MTEEFVLGQHLVLLKLEISNCRFDHHSRVGVQLAEQLLSFLFCHIHEIEVDLLSTEETSERQGEIFMFFLLFDERLQFFEDFVFEALPAKAAEAVEIECGWVI